MAVDKNAVREGTRWLLNGNPVDVLEVTARSVIFAPFDSRASVLELVTFAERASDPATGEHDELTKRFGSWADDSAMPPPSDLYRALSYLLVRVGPPAPQNVAQPAPKAAIPKVAEMHHAVIEEPAVCEPLVADVCMDARIDDRPSKRGRAWAA